MKPLNTHDQCRFRNIIYMNKMPKKGGSYNVRGQTLVV